MPQNMDQLGALIHQTESDRADGGKRYAAYRARRIAEVCEQAFSDVAAGATDPATAYIKRYRGTWADVTAWQLENPTHILPLPGAARVLYFEAFAAASARYR